MAQPPKRSWKDGLRSVKDFQTIKPIPKPNMAETFIPVVGPAWEAASDIEDGHYGAAALNAGMAALEVVPIGEMVDGLNVAAKVTGKVGKKVLSHRNVRDALKSLDRIHPGEEMHHIIRMKGASRSSANWKNNPLFVKALPQATHRRLHGSWGGLPKFGPVGQMWHGTNRVMKADAAGLLVNVTGAGVANISRPVAASHVTHNHKTR